MAFGATKFLIISVLFITGPPLAADLTEPGFVAECVTYARLRRNSEGRLRDFLLNQANFTSRDRPVLNPNHTLHVKLQMQLYAMLDLNERDEVITTSSWMMLNWKDERLFWDPAEFDGLDNIVMYVDEIWTPKIFISNSLTTDSLGLISPDRGSVILRSEGSVFLGTPLVQSTQCPLNVRYFPFDTQICPFSFIPVNQYHQHMYLTAEQPDVPSSLWSFEWNLLNTTILNFVIPFGSSIYPENNTWLSGTYVCVYLQRDPNYYITTIIMPSTLMCIMSFVTFLAPPDSGERISLGVSMVLGLTVFQLVISDTLPTSSKNSPILSSYLTINFILACLAVPFSLVNINIAYRGNKLSILKYRWTRKLLLERLPWFLCVSTCNETVRSNAMEVNTCTLMNDQMEVNTSKGHVNNIIKQNAVGLVESAAKKDHTINTEKVNFDTRIVAAVMDRLVLIGLLAVFCGFGIRAVVKFNANPGVTFEEC